MLNEIREANEYTCRLPLYEYELGRLKWKIFNHNGDMNGIERMLMNVARLFIFDTEGNGVTRRTRAEAAMRMWLGFSEGLKDGGPFENHYEDLKKVYPQLDGWLINYLKGVISDRYPEDKERLERFIEELQSKDSQFKTKSLRKKDTTSDFKLIRYDKIISNAIVSRGPLKRYYLVCAVPDWRVGTGKIEKKNPNSSVKSKDEDKILKLVAAYLLERNRKLKSNNDYVFEAINFTDIAFWAAADSRLSSDKYSMFTYEDSQTHLKRPLIEFYTTKSANMVKAKPDVEWLEYCGWDIIEAADNDGRLDEYLDSHRNAVFWSDPGSCHGLERNVRYIR